MAAASVHQRTPAADYLLPPSQRRRADGDALLEAYVADAHKISDYTAVDQPALARAKESAQRYRNLLILTTVIPTHALVHTDLSDLTAALGEAFRSGAPLAYHPEIDGRERCVQYLGPPAIPQADDHYLKLFHDLSAATASYRTIAESAGDAARKAIAGTAAAVLRLYRNAAYAGILRFDWNTFFNTLDPPDAGEYQMSRHQLPQPDTWATHSVTLNKFLVDLTLEKLLTGAPSQLSKEVHRADAQYRDRLWAMVQPHLPLVIDMAKSLMRKRSPKRLTLLDLIQEGNLGLLNAGESYSTVHGTDFITHAFPHVRNALLHAIWEQKRIVHVPRSSAKKIVARQSGTARHQSLPDRQHYLPRDVSLEEPLPNQDGDELSVGDTLLAQTPSPDEVALANDRDAKVQGVLSRIDPREGEILRLRSGSDGDPLTLEEIGKRFGLHRERIRQIEARTLRLLRTHPVLRKLA